MKKVFLFILVIIGFLGLYYWRLKNSFRFEVTALKFLELKDNQISLDLDVSIVNPYLPDFSTDNIYLDIWINRQYVGSLTTDELYQAKNGRLNISSSFNSDDIGLTTALLLEPDKVIDIQGKIEIISPVRVSMPVNYSDKL